MTDVRVVLVTAPEAEVAEAICRTLLEERLIACANVLSGMTSIYRWEGKVERDSEVLLILKTGAAKVPRLVDRVSELHPYEVPEVLSLEVGTGLDDYLNWVGRETATQEPS